MTMEAEKKVSAFNGDVVEQFHWFALYTRPRHEKTAFRYMQVVGMEGYLPLLCQRRKWRNGCAVEIQDPLFPSYLFMRSTVRGMRRALHVPGIVRIVNCLGVSSIIADEQIETLRTGLRLRTFTRHPYITVGQQVRIIAGPLA